MSVLLSPIGNGFQFFTSTGLPLNGGYLYTYQAGSSTPLTTYTDVTGTISNANPITLGTDGRPQTEIWLTQGLSYKFVLTDSANNQIQTYDNLYGILQQAPSVTGTVPSGLIAIWSGSVGSIPSGWVLCNGANGTPDLRNSFILGAGNSYSVGQTGGTSSITIGQTNLPNVNFNATSTVTDPGHTHTSNAITDIVVSNGIPDGVSGSTYALRTATINNAVTGITVATTVASGGSGTAINSLPPYYALAFIMKT
jgi:microcystin-dependent protein